MKKLMIILVMAFACILTLCAEDESILEPLETVQSAAETGAVNLPGVGEFSMAGIAAAILFGTFGFYAFMQGKKKKNLLIMLTGAGMMGYTYFIRGTLMIIIVGSMLFALYWLKRND